MQAHPEVFKELRRRVHRASLKLDTYAMAVIRGMLAGEYLLMVEEMVLVSRTKVYKLRFILRRSTVYYCVMSGGDLWLLFVKNHSFIQPENI
jgi:hypothetical protein